MPSRRSCSRQLSGSTDRRGRPPRRQPALPPGHAAHERGEAIDVGPPDGAAWLDVHGVHYGLCRRYANEAWHFELLAPAIDQQCPPLEPYAHT